MKILKPLLLLLILAVTFIAGMIYKSQQAPAVKIAQQQEKSFGGGFKESQDTQAQSLEKSDEGKVISVRPGELIQDAVNRAEEGDTIRVFPGEYKETVYIDKNDIKLIGVINQGERATLNGEERLNDAILYSGSGIVVENFMITRYKGNGIMGQAGNNFVIRNNIIADTGVYGIFPQLGKNGVIEHNVVSGIEDAAIYVGMSDNIHVAHNEVFDSVAGIEIENSRHAVVENNYTHHNTGGILAFITPGLPIKTTFDVIIRNNFVVDNNTANFGAPGSTVSGIPAGTGVLVMAADDVIIEDNIISNNKTAGIIITDHANAENVTIDPESEPNPDRISILDNVMSNNGYETIPQVKAYMLSKLKSGHPDIIAIGGGNESCINNPHRYITAGIEDYSQCGFTNTDEVEDYLFAEPVPHRVIDQSEQGKLTYLGVCTGCHTYTGRMIGPPIQVVQALYLDNPQGLADYIAKPSKKRDDYPEMPPQDYLSEEVRLAVAKYVLQLEK